MIQQSLLSHLSAQHDFSNAEKNLAMSNAKPFIRSWLALDLSLSLHPTATAEDMHFAALYQDSDFIKYNAKLDKIETCEKRHASRADLKIVAPEKNLWFEFHALHQDDLSSKKERNKLYEDVRRVEALRSAVPKDQVILLIGLWGCFSAEDINHFSLLDNSTRCTYVLDTSLTGSTQIARLSHMKREGEPRFLLAAF